MSRYSTTPDLIFHARAVESDEVVWEALHIVSSLNPCIANAEGMLVSLYKVSNIGKRVQLGKEGSGEGDAFSKGLSHMHKLLCRSNSDCDSLFPPIVTLPHIYNSIKLFSKL